MATFVLNQAMRGSIEYTLSGGQSAFNVIHFTKATGGPCVQNDVNAALDMLEDLVTNAFGGFHWTDFMSDQISVVGLHMRTVDPSNPLAADRVVSLPGDQTGIEPVAFESSVVTTHYTALPSRRGRGRTYIPGMAVNNIDNGLVNAGLVTTLNTIWNSWRTGIPGGQPVPGVWSSVANSGQTFTTSVTRNIWHHQKSRNT